MGPPRDVLAFWNSRAGLGKWAGTRDVIAKQLELEAIAGYVRDGMRILEVGCGNGITALELATRFAVQIEAVDFAEEMIKAAQELQSSQKLRGSVRFTVGDIRGLPDGLYDLIYTERALINLPDWPAQRAAMQSIFSRLKPSGSYLMCENSQNGLDAINDLRSRVGLPAIVPPWHNRYLRDAELSQVPSDEVALDHIKHYSSLYYLLSRVVNASLAAQAGTEPDYESPINKLALLLPSVGELGQGRIWLWKKR
jgi:ubiquinone/menaquinone biosynthesis C-methylase UbiE